jgi:hypothetical protein
MPTNPAVAAAAVRPNGDEPGHRQRYRSYRLDAAVRAIDVVSHPATDAGALQHAGERMPGDPVHGVVTNDGPKDGGDQDPAELKAPDGGQRTGGHQERVGGDGRKHRVERHDSGHDQVCQQWRCRQLDQVHTASVGAALGILNGSVRKSGKHQGQPLQVVPAAQR